MTYDTLCFGSEVIHVNIQIVDVRCVDIIANDDLSVTVRAPIGMSRDMVEKYIQMNRQTIYKEAAKKKRRNHQTLESTLELENGHILYHNGQKLPYLGNMNLNLRIKYLSKEGETSLYVDEEPEGERTLTIRTDNPRQEFLRYCIMRYYRKCAAELVRRTAGTFGEQLGLSFKQVQITGLARNARPGLSKFAYRNINVKNQETFWGRCSFKGVLKFDWKLVMLPMEVIDYIVVHELMHLKKMNHSAGFWSEIQKVMPEYAECRNWLNKHGKDYEMF